MKIRLKNSTTEDFLFFFERGGIPNTVINSYRKHYIAEISQLPAVMQ